MSAALDSLRRLGERLDIDGPDMARLDDAYRGKSPLSFLAPEVAAQVGTRLRSLNINFCRLVADSIAERLAVESFRVGAEAVGDPAEAELWAIWRRSGMHLRSGEAFLDALVCRRSYLSVWARPDGRARLAVESARQCYVEHGADGERVTALKRWTERGHGHAVVLTATDATRFRTLAPTHHDPAFYLPGYPPAPHAWEQVGHWDHRLGVVPVVPVVNRPRTSAPDGESELADVLGLSDAVSKLSTDLMVSAEFSAMPRRWATGIALPETPDGEIDTSAAFNMGAGRAWLLESPDARVGQMPGADLAGYATAVESLVGAIGAVSGLPPHFLGLKSAAPRSAAERRSSEASLVKRTITKQEGYGGSVAEAMQLSAVVESGRARPDLDGLETVWRSAETRTVAEAADAASKLVESEIVTRQQAGRDLGYTPAQLAQMAEDRRASALDSVGVDVAGLLGP